MTSTSTTSDLPFTAAAFAARAHRHQLRKDGKTPYVSHVFRVCLVVRHVFGLDDPRMLAAALLHDTIEDSPTDCDDIIAEFGPEVAKWVAALTKDMRLPHEEREAAYLQTLATADWQVKVIKLADTYDNLADSRSQPPEEQRKTAKKSRVYVEALRIGLPDHARQALDLVEARLTATEQSMIS